MPHRQLFQSRMAEQPAGELWSRHAARDLETAGRFLRAAGKHRKASIGYSAALLGAVIAYSRPFTEQAAPSLNLDPLARQCFLGLAADLGADLRLHAVLLQVRDAIIERSEAVSLSAGQLSARRFQYPDARIARLTRGLNPVDLQRLAGAMRIACEFFRAQIEARTL